jgi:large subunit ribosomal protein L3
VKHKLPADVPLPGKFRENGSAGQASQTAPEAPAAEETA